MAFQVAYIISLCRREYDLFHNFFPEYSDKKYSQSSYELREESYEFAVKRAFKIIVDTEKSAQDIIKNYNCSRDNLFEVSAPRKSGDDLLPLGAAVPTFSDGAG